MNQDTVGDPQIFSSPHVGNPATQQSLLLASCAGMQVENRWRIGGELHLNAVMEEKRWRSRHRVMLEAGHLTLNCGSEMVFTLHGRRWGAVVADRSYFPTTSISNVDVAHVHFSITIASPLFVTQTDTPPVTNQPSLSTAI